MNWLLAIALTSAVACAADDADDEWLWGVDLGRSSLAIGQQTFAASTVLGPYPNELPTPAFAAWQVDPAGIVMLSATSGSSIVITGVAAGTTVLTAENSDGETTSRTITVTP